MIKLDVNMGRLAEALRSLNSSIVIEKARKETKIMKVTLANGMTLEGTGEQVIKAARDLGYPIDDGAFYNSSVHGLIRIADMDDNHLRNAMLKIHREWAANIGAQRGYELAKSIREGCTNKAFLGLYTEFVRRLALGRSI